MKTSSAVCTAAVSLVGAASANLVLWMNGILTPSWPQVAFVAAGYLAGGALIHLGRCIERPTPRGRV